MAQILKAHGSKNDIFVAPLTPADVPDVQAFVRNLCDRSSPLGGADGIYFYDARPQTPQAWFFNPDGSTAELCGNGMRCLGRVILDQRDAGQATIRSGETEYTVTRAPVTPEGVHQIRLEHPAVTFRDTDAPDLTALLSAGPLTALTVPNPHLVAIVAEYQEPDLIAAGQILAKRHGPNLSFLLPVAQDEVFVRTFERGAGLTASCASGMVAARAVYSRLGHAALDQPVIIHNAGGVATVSLRDWRPILQGNATYVYRAEIDPAAPLPANPPVITEQFDDESNAYRNLEYHNELWLDKHGIVTAVASDAVPGS
jgi:diaminopimelate epimerase